MGIIPSSEQVTPKKAPPQVPLDAELAALLLDQKKLEALARYVGTKLKATRKKVADVMHKAAAQDALTPEEKEEQPSGELVLAGGNPSGQKEETCVVLPESEDVSAVGEDAIVTDTQIEKQDLILGQQTVVIKGEKHYSPSTGRTLAPDLGQVGPKGHEITWRALANIVVLVFGMALPAARIEKLFGKKGFSRSGLSDHCAYVAQRLLPVYIAMAKAIAQCDVVMGDDCVSRVSEVTRYKRDIRQWRKDRKAALNDKEFLASNPEPSAPWRAPKATSVKDSPPKDSPIEETSLKNKSLTRQLEDELDFEFENAKADKARTPKLRLHTSLLSGETETGNASSRIVFYRSHLGSVGNLLSKLLLSRLQSKKTLVFVGDLSPSNHVTDPNVIKRVSITYAGCASHARRPFKRHLDADPQNCIDALDYFRALFHVEELIAESLEHQKAEIRADTCMSFWQELKDLCESMLPKWSPATALGEGVRYLLGNYEKLTLYCRDKRLPASNDLSERLLRYEKLMDRSSFGRETVEGRARYDIIRSFWQTCVAAGVDPTFALLDVMLTPPETVASSPANYIPSAIAHRLKTNEERRNHLHKIYNCSNLADLVTYKLLDPNVPQAANLG